jgi:hypothetical protein
MYWNCFDGKFFISKCRICTLAGKFSEMERCHFDTFPNTDNGKIKSGRKTSKTVTYEEQ